MKYFFLIILFLLHSVSALTMEEWENQKAYKRWFYNGVWLFGKQKYDQAEGSFRKALELALNDEEKAQAEEYIHKIYSIREKMYDDLGIKIERKPVMMQSEDTEEVETFDLDVIPVRSLAKKNYLVGMKYLEDSRFQIASSYFQTAIRDNPAYGNAHVELAKIALFYEKDPLKAESILKDAVTAKPYFSLSHLWLGWIYYFYKEDLISAEEQFRECFTWASKNEIGGIAHAMLFQIARQKIVEDLKKEQGISEESFLSINHHLQEKLDSYERAALYIIKQTEELNEKWWVIPYISGILYKNTKNISLVAGRMEHAKKVIPPYYAFVIDTTLEDIKKSGLMLVSDPNSAEGHVAKGRYFLDHGEIEKAIEEFKVAIGINMASAEAHNYLGIALSQQGNSEHAITEFQLSVSYNKEYADAYYNLGKEYFNSKSIFEAVENLQKAVKYDNTRADAWAVLGEAYLEKKDETQALEAYKKSAELMPENAKVHLALGNIYTEREEYESALEEYVQAINFRKDYVEAYTNVGIVRYHQWTVQKDPKYLNLAIESMEKALEYDSENQTIQEYRDYFKTMR